MGKQVNFYMLRDDELDFLQFISLQTDFILVSEISSEAKIQIIEDRFLDQSIQVDLVQLILKDKSVNIEEKYLVRHEERKYITELACYVNTGKILYILDSMNAPVIEYSRSRFLPDHRLTRGRIWAEMYELVNQEFIYKGVEFEKSYERVARWLRRNLVRENRVPFYLGKEARKWYREGGELLP
jgi:hypothetical protein